MADDISSIIGAAASQYANDLEYTPLRHRLAPHLAGQALAWRLFFPIWANVDLVAAAAALNVISCSWSALTGPFDHSWFRFVREQTY
jgi:hypothetical protein